MRRAVLVCATALAAAIPAGGAWATTSPPPRAALEGFVCQRASNHLDRAIEVTAVMRPVTGTQRMAMKFVLLRRDAAGGPYSPVAGRDLGTWLAPSAGLGQRPTDVWKLNKVVVNLASASVYRFRVTFRWFGSSDLELQSTTLPSPVCTQAQ
jgi:hypothetical protein